MPRRPVDSNSRNFTLRDDNQKYVAVNIAHTRQKCKSSVAAFRILGYFHTVEELKAHAVDPQLDVYTVPAFDWFPITHGPIPEDKRKERSQQVVDRVRKYIDTNTELASKLVERTNEACFEERYDEAVRGKEKMDRVEKFLNEHKDGDFVRPVQRNDELRGQRWAVVSMIVDANTDDEPLVNFLRAFDSKEDARDYMRNTLHAHKIVTDAFVVQMYEWVTPARTQTTTFRQKIDTSYTHKELEDLHRGKQWEEQMIERLIASESKNRNPLLDEMGQTNSSENATHGSNVTSENQEDKNDDDAQNYDDDTQNYEGMTTE